MGWGIPIDIGRRFRATATAPSYFLYMQVKNMRIAVAQVPLPISQAPIPCASVIVQADLANGAIVVTGGPDCNLLNGLQLTAGQGTIYYPSEIPGDSMIRSSMGIGIQRFQGQAGGGIDSSKVRVVSLADIFLVASAALQFARITYIPITV